MRIAELSNLIQNKQYGQVLHALDAEKIRLNSISSAHPVFDLMEAFEGMNSGYSWRFGVPQEDRPRVQAQLTEIFRKFLEGGMDSAMRLQADRWKRDLSEDDRAKRGLTGSGKALSHYDINNTALYVRLAGLDWVDALKVMHEAGYRPTPVDHANALVQAIRHEHSSSLGWLLEQNLSPAIDEGDTAVEDLMKWKGVPADLAAQVVKLFDEPPHRWVDKAHSNQYCDRTCVEWMGLEPGRWEHLHASLDPAKQPGVWTALFRHFVQTGEQEHLVEEALASPSFERFKHHPMPSLFHSYSWISWLAQGGALREVPDQTKADWQGETPNWPAQHLQKAQLRRMVRLLRSLEKSGCALRQGQGETTESMVWAQRGFVPTTATLHRHPAFLLPACQGQTPLHAASSVEVALKWEQRGVLPIVDSQGVDPWVLGFQKAEKPAPWAREIAQRVKEKRLSVHAQGMEGKTLFEISGSNAPLARFILKKSKQDPSIEMLQSAMQAHQWGLVGEWVASGWLERAPQVVEPLVEGVVAANVFRETRTIQENWEELAKALHHLEAATPTKVELWRRFCDTHSPFDVSRMEEFTLKRLQLIASWGIHAQHHWNEEDRPRLLQLIRGRDDWQKLCPVSVSAEEAVHLFWDALLDTQYSGFRVSAAQRLWTAFDKALPIHRAGPGMFKKLRAVEREVHAWDYGEEFKRFIEAEQLLSATPQASPSATRRVRI